MTVLRAHTPVIAQTASAWPASDAGWTTQPLLSPIDASEGAGQVVGDATLQQEYGLSVKQPDGTTIGAVASLTSLDGKFLRLLKADPAGSVTISSMPYEPFWWGRISGSAIDAARGLEAPRAWRALGLAAVLDGIKLTYGLERAGAYAGASDIVQAPYLPVFNDMHSGDMSTTTSTVDGVAVHVFQRWSAANREYWTGTAALKHLLAAFGRPRNAAGAHAGGLTWTLSDPLGLLERQIERTDLAGLSLLDAVNRLINAQLGATWQVQVSGATATIRVRSTVRTAITVGAFTLAASDAQQAVDLTAGPWIGAIDLRSDATQVADVIEIRGARPRTALTIAYGAADPGWVDGWSSTALAELNAGRQSAETENVFHRFALDDTWQGEQWPAAGDGLANVLATDADGGFTGVRSWAGWPTGSPAPAGALELERTLPLPAGLDLTAVSAYRPDLDELTPLVFLGDPGGTMHDLTQVLRVRVDHDPPAIVLGSGHEQARLIEYLLANGATMLVTLSVREAVPLIVSWRRPSASWPSDVPRMVTIEVPHAERWRLMAGTALKVGQTSPSANLGVQIPFGTLATRGAELLLRDDTDLLREYLALARARYESPTASPTWTEHGTLDISSTRAPGVLITDVTVADGTTTADAVIVRRSWRFAELKLQTTYETERVLPDLGAIP